MIILIIIVVVVVLYFVLAEDSGGGNNNNSYNSSSSSYSYKASKPKNELDDLTLEELFVIYKEEQKVPALDGITKRAYEQWKIHSDRNYFDKLDEEDKKTVVRIAIFVGRKKQKEKEQYKNIRDRW